MNRRIVCGLLLSFAAAGCFAREARVDPDIPPGAGLPGEWSPVSAVMGGKDFAIANFGGATLHLTGHAYEFAGDQGTYEVVSMAPPARMDLHGQQGPNAGKLIPTIYQVSGDQLDIAYQLGTGVRPHDFSSPTGSHILVIHYRRTH